MTSGPCSKAGRSRPGGLPRLNGSCVTSASGARRSPAPAWPRRPRVLLMIGAFGAWRYYSEWRLGRIVLTTDGPPLAAEVLPASSGDRPIGEPFDVGTRTVLTLPAGDYRLRVKAAGLMSQTYRVAVNRGETRTHRSDARRRPLAGKRAHPVFARHRSRHVDSGQGRLHRVERRDPDPSRRIDGQADLGRRAARAAVESRTRPGRRDAPAVPFRR